MKNFTPEECTLNPECSSVPSHSVYSFSRGFAAAIFLCVSRFLLRLCANLRLLTPSNNRVFYDTRDASCCLVDVFASELSVVLRGAGIGVAEQANDCLEFDAAHHDKACEHVAAVVEAHTVEVSEAARELMDSLADSASW